MELPAVRDRQAGVERQLGRHRWDLPVDLEQVAGAQKPFVPAVADLVDREAPLPEPLPIGRQRHVEQFEIDLTGQLDEVAVRVDRHQEHRKPVVAGTAVAVLAARQKHVELDRLGAKEHVRLLRGESDLPVFGELRSQCGRFVAGDLQVIARAAQLELQLLLRELLDRKSVV